MFKNRIEEIKMLKFGWDDLDAEPIDEAVIQFVEEVLTSLVLQHHQKKEEEDEDVNDFLLPTIYPSPDGGIDLSWENSNFVCMVSKDSLFIQHLCEPYENQIFPFPENTTLIACVPFAMSIIMHYLVKKKSNE